MKRQAALAMLLGLWAGTAAFAASPPPAKEPMPGTSVEMPYLIAPVTVDDKLLSYAYISGKIVATSPSAAIEVRAKLPFVQDAFVRDVNGAPVATANDVAAIDQQSLAQRLLGDARRIVGTDKIAFISITRVQLAPLRGGANTDPQ
jgi:hypothetical protein